MSESTYRRAKGNRVEPDRETKSRYLDAYIPPHTHTNTQMCASERVCV